VPRWYRNGVREGRIPAAAHSMSIMSAKRRDHLVRIYIRYMAQVSAVKPEKKRENCSEKSSRESEKT